MKKLVIKIFSLNIYNFELFWCKVKKTLLHFKVFVEFYNTQNSQVHFKILLGIHANFIFHLFDFSAMIPFLSAYLGTHYITKI